MVHVCEDYAQEYDVTFNGAKSLFLIFKGRDCPEPAATSITVNNVSISNVTDAVHLGHKLSTANKDSMVTAALAQFWGCFNLFRADFGNVTPYVQCKLFKQYCCCFYGAPLWRFSSNAVKDVCIAWRKALRKIWRVPPMTHCNVIAILSESKPLELGLMSRFCKFYNGITENGTNVLKTIVKVARNNPASTFCNNYVDICCKYDTVDMKECQSLITKNWFNGISDTLNCDVIAFRELIDIRDGLKVCHVLSSEEVDNLISEICIN